MNTPLESKSRADEIRTRILSDRVWRRHANPWSVWTRLPILFLTSATLWYREVLGISQWVLLAVLAGWTWINPRVFPEPARFDSWASRSTLGERTWLDRRHHPIPRHHQAVIRMLIVVTAAGFVCLAIGLWRLEALPSVSGLLACYMGKLWFLDRMVWLQRETANPTNTQTNDHENT